MSPAARTLPPSRPATPASASRPSPAARVPGGQPIRAGDKIVVYHASAHYDERNFRDPFRFDITRKPNDHVAFGFGPHTCLGAMFARLQMRIFFTEFLQALPQVELAAPPVHLVSNFINGLTHLPIRWAA
ncbi:MAG TPA: cytochrome P450 [Trebonia sp.]|nr:cytochrome P450 [Trebonia sp.]